MKTGVSPLHTPFRFTAHSRKVLEIAMELGWQAGARYTNLRDVRHLDRLGFLDIDWKNYSFAQHLAAAKATRPFVTVARDIERARQVPRVLAEAEELSAWATHVIIVPKAKSLAYRLDEVVPARYWLGYSVPSRYGGTCIPPDCFRRPVHLLGGRPDRQRHLAKQMPVVSFDCNRFTLDASFGDYFDGNRFVRHPIGGYGQCIRDSVVNTNRIWAGYVHLPMPSAPVEQEAA